MHFSRKTQTVLWLIASAWPLVVMFYYWQEHDYANLFLQNLYFTNLLVLWGALYLGILAYKLLRNRSLELVWQTKPWKLSLSLLIFVILAGSLLMTRSGILGQVPFLSMLWNLSLKISLLFLILTVISYWSISFGSYLLGKLKLALDSKLETYLLSLGLGLSTLSLTCFLLALLGLFTLVYLLPILVLLLGLAYRQARQVLRDFSQGSLVFNLKLASPEPFFLSIFLSMLTLNILSLIRPVPIGWDGLAGYMNNAQLLANRGALLSGVNSYAYELIMSIGFLLSSNASISLALSSLIILPSLLLIYSAVKKYATRSTASITALLLYAVPLVMFHAQQESKVDLASIFWAGLSMLCFYYFWKVRSLKFLGLAAFLAGFAFSIKYTNLFLIVALFLTLLYGFYLYRPWGLKKMLGALLCFAFFASLPFLPWAAWNTWTSHGLHGLASGAYNGPGLACDLPAATSTTSPPLGNLAVPLEHESAKIDQVFNFSGYREEIDRYLGYSTGLSKYLLTPWTLTMNLTVGGMYVDMGFVFLALLPLALLFALLHGSSKPWKLLGVFTLFYWLIWLILGRGIIWYALPGFLPLILIIGKFYQHSLAAKSSRIALQLFLSLVALLGLNSALIGYGHPADVAYATGLFDEQLYIDNTMPSYRAIYTEINRNPGNVYRMGTFIKYFITDNDQRVFTDDQMDTLACLITSRPPAEVISALKSAGFRYLVLDLNIPSIDQTPEKSLTRKFELVKNFLEQHTQVLKNETVSRNKILFSEI